MWLLVLKMPKYTSTITQSPDGKHLRGDNTNPSIDSTFPSNNQNTDLVW